MRGNTAGILHKKGAWLKGCKININEDAQTVNENDILPK